ncbi:unnamed protein product [Symbiodinium sp. CCMP2592]|nr:unnamed protein product [Symbiodinium sp. CCMP2592]
MIGLLLARDSSAHRRASALVRPESMGNVMRPTVDARMQAAVAAVTAVQAVNNDAMTASRSGSPAPIVHYQHPVQLLPQSTPGPDLRPWDLAAGTSLFSPPQQPYANVCRQKGEGDWNPFLRYCHYQAEESDKHGLIELQSALHLAELRRCACSDEAWSSSARL